MTAPSLFPRQRELVNYDYYDIAEGTGYTVFYGFKGDAGEYGTTSVTSLYSEEIATATFQAATGSYVKLFDADFNIEFARPKNIKGKLYANVPVGAMADNANEMNIEYYVVVKAIHYDGSTETTLATGTSRVVEADDFSNDQFTYTGMTACCIMDVSSVQHFKPGEILRFTVEAYFKEVDASNGYDFWAIVGHDPANRIFDPTTSADEDISRNYTVRLANQQSNTDYLHLDTQIVFHVPFKLDV